MNFKQLQDETSELLNFNVSQADQDFTLAQIKSAVNRAYRREYVRARQEGVRRFFLSTTDVTWPSGALTLDLPPHLAGAQILRVADITGGLPGTELSFGERGIGEDITWKTRATLQWGSAGPGSAKTLHFQYFPGAGTMVNDDDYPELIPEEHHELIFYSAAIDLRNRADELAPQAWTFEREDLRQDFWKDISRNRPHDDVVGIRRLMSDAQGV